jgi:hypothetical protein
VGGGKESVVKGSAHYPEEGRDLFLELFGRRCAPDSVLPGAVPPGAEPPLTFEIVGPPTDATCEAAPASADGRPRPVPGVMEVIAYGRKA